MGYATPTAGGPAIPAYANTASAADRTPGKQGARTNEGVADSEQAEAEAQAAEASRVAAHKTLARRCAGEQDLQPFYWLL
jgi:hypothetical protein